jgi:hypothetical protein
MTEMESLLAVCSVWVDGKEGVDKDRAEEVATCLQDESEQAEKFLALRGRTIRKQRQDMGAHPRCAYCGELATRLNELGDAVTSHLAVVGTDGAYSSAL